MSVISLASSRLQIISSRFTISRTFVKRQLTSCFYTLEASPNPVFVLERHQKSSVRAMASKTPKPTESLNMKESENYIVWVDCEMTGLDPETDTLLEIAVIITDKNLNIVEEGPCLIIHQPDEVLLAMGDWCTRQHTESGLVEAVRKSELTLEECQSKVLDFIKQHVPAGKCPLGGNSIGQDAKFLCKYMPDFMNHLHYRVVDVSTVKELARRWFPEVLDNAPKKKFEHRALDDIKASIEELKFYRENIFKSGPS